MPGCSVAVTNELCSATPCRLPTKTIRIFQIACATVALVVGLAAAGVPSATAADLGDNCCADLEERVNDLRTHDHRFGNVAVTNSKTSTSISAISDAGTATVTNSGTVKDNGPANNFWTGIFASSGRANFLRYDENGLPLFHVINPGGDVSIVNTRTGVISTASGMSIKGNWEGRFGEDTQQNAGSIKVGVPF